MLTSGTAEMVRDGPAHAATLDAANSTAESDCYFYRWHDWQGIQL
jgi:hypothetical protein